ncbi:MAG: tetraacyldisaccharide 4'-kinase [Simkaniaceae bacterium]|nr:tetraacyldisaccharide 4'-kinase [Simkaniaceae bacterium]
MQARLILRAESRLVSLITRGRARGLFWLLSLPYAGVIKLRNALYDWGWLRIKRAKPYVVSVGSVYAGGSGKSPVVSLLAERLGNVAIVSRGYRSRVRGVQSVHESDYAEAVGDEPLMLKRRSPEAEVIVAKRRFDGAQATKRNLALLDDGMQHRALYRDMEIVVVDGAEKGGYLPMGFLRDDPARIAKADYIFITGDGQLNTHAPQIRVKSEIGKIENAQGKALDEARVALFCAIARPERVEKSLKGIGLDVVDRLFLADHSPFDANELEAFLLRARAKGAQSLICTEKDWVKLSPQMKRLPIYCASLSLKITEGSEHFEHLIRQLTEKL